MSTMRRRILGTSCGRSWRRVLKRSEAVKVAARRFIRLDNAPLKLGIMCTIGSLHFMSFPAQFRADHRDIELTLAR
jgi:LysR family hydrogen peroxide-inducible transcriptional activator